MQSTIYKSANTHEAIMAHQYVGNFYSDSAQMDLVDKFAADNTQPIAHRADVLRHMAREGMGLTGPEAGDDLSDEELLLEFMADRA